MKVNDILRALNHVDERYIAESSPTEPKRQWRKWGALAACLCLMIFGGTALLQITVKPNVYDTLKLSSRSTGVQIRGVRNPPASHMQACLVGLTLEEIFTDDLDIFRGTIKNIANYELSFNGRKSYRAIVEIEIDTVIQGKLNPGDTARILAPCPIDGEIHQTATDVVAQMRAGMEGIFMPKAYNADSRWEENDATLYLQDLAPYGFWDGVRWAFLDAGEGLVFDKHLYTEIAHAETLDEVEDYIREQLG